MKDTIGLVGIGLVGGALAQNLLAAGYALVGYDVDPAKVQALVRWGGQAAASPAAVAQRASRLLLSLMDSQVVRRVVEGPEGVLEGTGPIRLIVDTTTGEPEQTVALAERLRRRGIALLDATISGSSEQIRGKQGVFMIGGARKAFDRARDLFEALATAYYYLGPSGSGCRAKLATNLILGSNRLALAEGLVFAQELGLDLRQFLALLKATPAYSRAVDVKGEKMLSQEFSPQSRISQHAKDLRIILQLAEAGGQELPLARLHHALLEAAEQAGDGDLDTSAVIRQLRRMRLGSRPGPEATQS